MISALRKIEGRGELHGATSAVMEMCVDNPREEFTDLFSTHPPIEKRIKALVDVMGGHDPGPIALPEPEDEAQADSEAPGPGDTQALPGSAPQGPWGGVADQASQPGVPQGAPSSAPWGQPAEPAGQRPFLPDRPPIDLGRPPAAPPGGAGQGGPWGKPGGG
jgi:heat shock protein HtpX